MQIVLTRGVFVGAAPHVPGTILEVSDQFGRELVAMKKADFVTDKPAAAGPMTVDSAPALAAKPVTQPGATVVSAPAAPKK
jgi:hypothetical protein